MVNISLLGLKRLLASFLKILNKKQKKKEQKKLKTEKEKNQNYSVESKHHLSVDLRLYSVYSVRNVGFCQQQCM